MKNYFTRVSILLFSGLCLSGLQSAAQTNSKKPVSANTEQRAAEQIRSANSAADDTYYIFNNRSEDVQGTPFLSHYWQKADLFLQNNKVMKDIPIKYDLMENNLIALHENGDSVILATGLVKEFIIHEVVFKYPKKMIENRTVDKLYRRYTFPQDSRIVDAYFEVLSEANGVVLLKHLRKNINRSNKEVSYNVVNNADQIVSKVEYYVVSASGKAKAVKLSLKGLDKSLEEIGVSNRESLTPSVKVTSEQELVSAFQLVAVR